MNDYKIWITYHKDEQIGKYSLKEDDCHKLFATHKDVEGKNINHMNPVYSEMTTMWYVWKNAVKSAFVGFNHYRRQFQVNRLPNKGECQVLKMQYLVGQTIYQQYAQWHNSRDMDIILQCLDERYGKDNVYSKYILNDSLLVPKCCFLMKWTDFNKMCKFLFPLIDDFAAACGISNTNVEEWKKKAEKDFKGVKTDYQTRAVSFISERLISAWILNNLSPYIDGRNVAVVHYNTPELLEAAISSLMKHTLGCHVFVFDNSDKKPFTKKMPNVEVIDNTKGQLIDFDKELAKYPNKHEKDKEKSNYGSAKHTMSVDKLMEIVPNGFVLMDSDVLIKADIKTLFNRNVACVGAENTKHNIPLLMPFLCYINSDMLREKGIKYFNAEKMWALSDKEPDCWYDTGAWLLEDVRSHKLPVEYVNIWQYVIHFSHGSWHDRNGVDEWLKTNKMLWE